MKLDQETIKTMNAAGISFYVQIDVPVGSANIELSPNEIPLFINNKEQHAANYFGVPLNRYREWVESVGAPRCGAITKSGKRCKNFVSGGIMMSMEKWLHLDGDYCTVHGGETSEEAASHRKYR